MIINKSIFKNKYLASVALPTVVLISSVLLLGGLSIITMSIDIRHATGGFNFYTKARLDARACLEEGMQIIKFDPDYTGSFTMNLPTGSCSIVVSNIGGNPTLKEVVVSSENGRSIYEEKYQADVSSYPLTLTPL